MPGVYLPAASALQLRSSELEIFSESLLSVSLAELFIHKLGKSLNSGFLQHFSLVNWLD